MQITQSVVAILIGYALGCIQTAFFVGELVRHIDIRQQGSGNAGASNVVTVLGWKYGVITGLVDILKGVLAVIIVRAVYPSFPALAYSAGLAAIVGHIFPFYLGFRGGKGVATLVGMMFGFDYRFGLLFVAVMLVVTLATDYIAIASITVFTLLPVVTFILKFPLAVQIAAALLTILAYVKHAENVQRIRNGAEPHVRATLKR